MHRENSVAEKLKRIGMVLCIFLVLGLVGNLVQYMTGLGSKPEEQETVVETTEEPTEPKIWAEPVEVPAEEIQKLKIEWVAGAVTVETGDVDQIQFRETEARKELSYTVRDGELLIRYSKDSFQSLLGIHSKKGKELSVILPETWQGTELDLEIVNADTVVKNLQVGLLEHDSMDGDLSIENCRADQVTVQTVSGGILYTGAVRTLSCESVSGSCRIEAVNRPERITMKGVPGAADLVLPEDAGFTAQLDGVETELNTDFEVTCQENTCTAGDGSCAVTFDGISGGISIRKAA